DCLTERTAIPKWSMFDIVLTFAPQHHARPHAECHLSARRDRACARLLQRHSGPTPRRLPARAKPDSAVRREAFPAAAGASSRLSFLSPAALAVGTAHTWRLPSPVPGRLCLLMQPS